MVPLSLAKWLGVAGSNERFHKIQLFKEYENIPMLHLPVVYDKIDIVNNAKQIRDEVAKWFKNYTLLEDDEINSSNDIY